MNSKQYKNITIINYVEMPLVNLVEHGDVKAFSEKKIRTMAVKENLNIEIFEKRKGFRMHCVLRK